MKYTYTYISLFRRSDETQFQRSINIFVRTALNTKQLHKNRVYNTIYTYEYASIECLSVYLPISLNVLHIAFCPEMSRKCHSNRLV